jgi:hypothetical protein
MKREECARSGCHTEVTLVGQKYCSRACAPYGHLGGAAIPFAKKTEESGTREDGDRSARFAGGSPQQENDMPNATKMRSSEKSTKHKNERLTEATPNTPENAANNTIDPNPTSGESDEAWSALPMRTDPTKPDVTDTSDSSLGVNAAIQLLEFVVPSQSLSVDRSLPLNLIDSSVVQLHDVMKQVCRDSPEKKTNPEMINALCNCAKNIRDLLKLKLDIAKTASGN